MTSPDENLLGSFVTFFDHGLLMIDESESKAAHDGWDATTEYVHFDQDSLYIAVQSVVDGAVMVNAYRENAPGSETEGLVEAFSGEVESKYGRFKIHDSDDKAVLVIAGRSGRNQLTVLLDELNWATRVVVVIGTPA
ncbi:hypothetical protein AB0C12_12920 [Actinoplanes sp. NPDC048967]|uniref:hypothetical protein n=1 Tax=Actinoplanes sp. NPDC048967 TaxID=3155269 RepID=UPI0033DCE72B